MTAGRETKCARAPLIALVWRGEDDGTRRPYLTCGSFPHTACTLCNCPRGRGRVDYIVICESERAVKSNGQLTCIVSAGNTGCSRRMIGERRKKNMSVCCRQSRTLLPSAPPMQREGTQPMRVVTGECRKGRGNGKDGAGEGERKATRVDSIACHPGFLRAFWKKTVS
jgi:hypothetical protein